MPLIQLSEQAYVRLLRRSSSFSDTAEHVVLRLLDETEAQAPDLMQSVQQDNVAREDQATARAIPGSILPEREYWLPILEIIEQAGGSAAATDVIEALGERMNGLLTPLDYETLAMGEVRWRNRARFARLRMTERGLLSSKSHRGLWEITKAGGEFLEAGTG
jgi:hypothetical protein